jgi:hypothetical protein
MPSLRGLIVNRRSGPGRDHTSASPAALPIASVPDAWCTCTKLMGCTAVGRCWRSRPVRASKRLRYPSLPAVITVCPSAVKPRAGDPSGAARRRQSRRVRSPAHASTSPSRPLIATTDRSGATAMFPGCIPCPAAVRTMGWRAYTSTRPQYVSGTSGRCIHSPQIARSPIEGVPAAICRRARCTFATASSRASVAAGARFFEACTPATTPKASAPTNVTAPSMNSPRCRFTCLRRTYRAESRRAAIGSPSR